MVAILLAILFSVVLGEGITDACPKCYVGICDMQQIYSFQETLSESNLNVVLTSFCHYGVLNSIKLNGDLFPGTNPISFGHGAMDEFCIERIEYSIDGQMLLTTDCMFPLNEVLESAGIAQSSIELDEEITIHVESGVFDGKVITPKYFDSRRSMPRIKRDSVGEKWTHTRNVGKVVSFYKDYEKIKNDEEHPLSKVNNPKRRSGDEPDYVQEDHIFYPLIFILNDEGYVNCNFKVQNWVSTAIPVPLGFHIFAGEERMEVLVAILTPKFDSTYILSYENTRFVSNLIGYFRPEELTQVEAESAFGWSHWEMLEDFDIALYSMQYTFPHCFAMDGVYLGLGGSLTTMAGDGYIEWEFNGTIPYTCVHSINIDTQFSAVCGDPNDVHGLNDLVEVSAKAVSQSGARLFNFEVESAAIHKTTDNELVTTLKDSGVTTTEGTELGYDEEDVESNDDETELTKKISFILDGNHEEIFASASDSRDSLAVNLKLKVSYEDRRTGEIETDIVEIVKTLGKENGETRSVDGGSEESYCLFGTDIVPCEYDCGCEFDCEDDEDDEDDDSPAWKREISNYLAMFL